MKGRRDEQLQLGMSITVHVLFGTNSLFSQV